MHPSFATRLNLDLLEQNYERWQKDPDSLDSGWSAFFEGFELGNLDGKNGAAVVAGAPRTRGGLRGRTVLSRLRTLVFTYRILCHNLVRVVTSGVKQPAKRPVSPRPI